LIAAKNCLDWHCSTPVQIGVAAFIAQGRLTYHVRKMRSLYQERRRLLLTALGQDFAEWLSPIPSFYGMHVAAFARASLDLDRVAEALLQHHVKIHSLARYYLGPSRPGLIFGYGAADPQEISRGLSALRKALRGI